MSCTTSSMSSQSASAPATAARLRGRAYRPLGRGDQRHRRLAVAGDDESLALGDTVDQF
jgi:hypothetical protein